MKRCILLICALALPGLALAWNGGANSGPPPDRSSRNTMMLHEMQRRSYERDQEWRRRDEDQRRRVEEERQRDMWRREDQRRRENTRLQDERVREGDRRRAYEAQRLERFQHELLQRDEEKRKGGKGGSYREQEYKGKPLDAKELRRYDLIKPGERP